MKNTDLWESYVEYTRTLTDVARKLGFAAAAICWFFKMPNSTFPNGILVALGFVVLYFICDMLQFFLGAIVLRCWTRAEEKRKWKETGDIEGNYDKPTWLDYPSYAMWWLKIISLLVAFVFIGLHVLYGYRA